MNWPSKLEDCTPEKQIDRMINEVAQSIDDSNIQLSGVDLTEEQILELDPE